ncbi:MAG: fibronectin type III domain-containing protein [Lachnospiraceae bacterium]|nr:fibronectin type III domain-containing protein [Lachnospiraceae bacterium]
MRKKLMRVLIFLGLLLGMNSLTWAAVKYDLWVNNEQFADDKLTIPCGSGSAVFDPNTKVLTLNQAVITKGVDVGYGCGILSGLRSLRIVLRGENKISAPQAEGITNYGTTNCDIVVSGPGSLEIEALNSTDSYGIYSTGALSLVEGCSIAIRSFATGLHAFSGLYLDKVKVNIQVTGRITAGYYGMAVNKSGVFVDGDSEVTVHSSGSAICLGETADDQGSILQIKSGTVNLTSDTKYAVEGANTAGSEAELDMQAGKLTAAGPEQVTNLSKISLASGLVVTDGSMNGKSVVIEKKSTPSTEHSHTPVKDERTATAATCTSKGKEADTVCSVCGELIEKGRDIQIKPHKYTSSAVQYCEYGCKTVNPSYRKPATSTGIKVSDAVSAYQVDTTTADRILDVAERYQLSRDVFALSPQKLTALNNTDADVSGSSYVKLQARQSKAKTSSITIKWNKVSGADGYIVYANQCGKTRKLKMAATLTAGQTSYTQKKLKKGTYYKYIVAAYKQVGQAKVTLAASRTLHIATSGGSVGNPKSVKVQQIGKTKKKLSRYTLAKSGSAKIKAVQVQKDKRIKKHSSLRFESSNPAVASVDKKGVIKGMARGVCELYVFAQNGISTKIKVTVK